jgi:hypothetical protein
MRALHELIYLRLLSFIFQSKFLPLSAKQGLLLGMTMINGVLQKPKKMIFAVVEKA